MNHALDPEGTPSGGKKKGKLAIAILIGENARRLRERDAGLTQEQVGWDLGWGKTRRGAAANVSMVEGGKNISLLKLQQLAEYYNVDYYEFFIRDGLLIKDFKAKGGSK